MFDIPCRKRKHFINERTICYCENFSKFHIFEDFWTFVSFPQRYREGKLNHVLDKMLSHRHDLEAKKQYFLRKWTQLSLVKTLTKVQKSFVCFCKKSKKIIINHQKIWKTFFFFVKFSWFLLIFWIFLPIYMSTDM